MSDPQSVEEKKDENPKELLGICPDGTSMLSDHKKNFP